MKVYKVSAKKSVEELFLMIPKSHSVHPLPLPLSAGELSLQPNFQKWWAWPDLNLLRGVAGKEGMTFFKEGGCNFYMKNKLRFEIFNDKKSL